MSYESTTPNIQLPQWVPSDKPQMTDFNTAFSDIDTAVGGKLDANNYAHIATPVTTGTRSAFLLSLDPPLTAYVSGMILAVNFHVDFSVGYMSGEPYSTININGLGAKEIQYVDSANTGTVKAGVHPIMYDSSRDGWIILDQVLETSGGNLTGPLTTQDITPDTNGTRNIGNTSKRYAAVYAANGNFSGQLAAGSAMLSGALTTQDIVPDNNNSRNLGTDSKRYKSIKAFVGSFGEQITSPSGIFDNYLEVQGNEVWHPGNLKIATGESSIGDTGTGKSDTVTISLSSYGFVKRPVVFVSPNSTDLNTWAHVTQATATSFTVVGGRNSTNPGGFGFMWLAVQL